MKKLILLLCVSVLAFSACGTNKKPDLDKDALKEEIRELIEEEIAEELAEREDVEEEEMSFNLTDNTIDFDTIAVGDQVGAMLVTDIELYSYASESLPGEYSSTVTFEGEITLAGNWTHSEVDAPFFADMICLTDVEDNGFLPIFDGRSKNLCFKNQNHAKTLFDSEPGDSGYAIFTIDHYEWIGRESEVRNMGTLVDLV